MESLEALDKSRRAHPEVFDAGGERERSALAQFTHFFSHLAAERIAQLLDATYADDVFFNDTLKSVRGSAALKTYLLHSADAVEDCRVTIEETTRTVHGEYLLRWRMMIRFKRVRRGVDTWSIGVSHLRFARDGRVVYHQDYWNAAEGLYQHIPVIGGAIRWIQRRL